MFVEAKSHQKESSGGAECAAPSELDVPGIENLYKHLAPNGAMKETTHPPAAQPSYRARNREFDCSYRR